MNKIPENIVIATGIYPPEIGGPAEYARELFDSLLIQKYQVSIVTYGELKKFPTGLRHLLYFIKLIFDALGADYIIALDTFSVGVPAVIFGKIFGKKTVLRVGGDFLWESYLERTKEEILLSQFYQTSHKFSLKERIIFRLTKFVLRSATTVVFSTDWQRKIMEKPYNLDLSKTKIIENFFPLSEMPASQNIQPKVFLSPSRDVFIKNKKRLIEAFQKIKEKYPEFVLDTEQVSHDVLLQKMSKSYAVIVNSFSEVSSNLVCDALASDLPAILTSDNGLYERLQNMVVFTDPFSSESLVHSIETLLEPETYQNYKRNILLNSYSHSWDEITQEFIDIYQSLSQKQKQ
jgi:glycosyltransferase involved in cell wall biosynthesis